jgi:hypothetical protein
MLLLVRKMTCGKLCQGIGVGIDSGVVVEGYMDGRVRR